MDLYLQPVFKSVSSHPPDDLPFITIVWLLASVPLLNSKLLEGREYILFQHVSPVVPSAMPVTQITVSRCH